MHVTDLIKPLCKNHSGSATVLYGATTFSCTPEGYRKDAGRMPEGHHDCGKGPAVFRGMTAVA